MIEVNFYDELQSGCQSTILSKVMLRLRRGDGGWALSAKGHQSIKHQVMRTLQVAKCDMSIIRRVVKCDMSPGGSRAAV